MRSNETPVDEGHIARPSLDQLERTRPGGRLVHGVPHRFEDYPQDAPVVRLIVHDQDIHGQPSRRGPNPRLPTQGIGAVAGTDKLQW